MKKITILLLTLLFIFSCGTLVEEKEDDIVSVQVKVIQENEVVSHEENVVVAVENKMDADKNLNFIHKSAIDLYDEEIPQEIKDQYLEFLRNIKLIDEKDVEMKRAEIKRNKDMFIYLYKDGKLPVYQDLGSSILSPYTYNNRADGENRSIFSYKEKIENDIEKDCFGNCIIIDNFNAKLLNYEVSLGGEYGGFFSYLDNKLLYSLSAGGACTAMSENTLFDKDFNTIETIKLHQIVCGSELLPSGLSKGGYEIQFYSKKNNSFLDDNFIFDGSIKILNLLFVKEENQNLKYILFMEEKDLYFDINENLLNGKIISYKVDKIDVTHGFNELDSGMESSTESINKILNENFIMLGKKVGNGQYKIDGEMHQNKNDITIIEVYSCKENLSKEYDVNPYVLKSFHGESTEFNYGISKDYGNYCDIPYKFRFYNSVGEYSEVLVEVIFD